MACLQRNTDGSTVHKRRQSMLQNMLYFVSDLLPERVELYGVYAAKFVHIIVRSSCNGAGWLRRSGRSAALSCVRQCQPSDLKLAPRSEGLYSSSPRLHTSFIRSAAALRRRSDGREVQVATPGAPPGAPHGGKTDEKLRRKTTNDENYYRRFR